MSRIEEDNYSGWDPYDGLKSPLFKLPLLRSNKSIRFISQQLIKRSPVNLRPLLGIPKGRNPVTLGLCIQAYTNLAGSRPDEKNEYLNKIHPLVTELETLVPEGYSGACWGYDFDWAARNASIPAFQPNVVATGIISNALFQAWQAFGIGKCRDLCISAAAFVKNDLHRTYEGDAFCFSYSPFDRQQVFNASMKGARLLSQAYSLTGEADLKAMAEQAVRFVVRHQREDGSWFYSLAKKGNWIDNYHSGYILDCLDEYIKMTGDNRFSGQLAKGYHFYKTRFFEPSAIPKFSPARTYPIDCTAAGQSLLTLCRFGDHDLALRVASWMMQHMQSRKGNLYYRRSRLLTRKTSFMRWSNAWMFAGLAQLSPYLPRS